MATARERLMQLNLAQREAEERANEVQQAALPSPRGGGILQRPIRPSEARQIDPEDATPLLDFGEFFLNQLGISSARQRRAQIETIASVDEANRTMLDATREKMQLVQRRGLGGINAERFQEATALFDNAAKLLDNPVPEIQQFGRQQIQSIANTLDVITQDQDQFLDQQRDRIQGRLDSVMDLAMQEQRLNDDVTAILNARGERNGVNSKLSSFEKQVIAGYLGGSSFTQKEGEEGLLPGFGVPFDPTEELTVGNATVLVEAVKKSRMMTIADQLGRENQNAINSGFSLADKDGRLSVNEIPVPELGPEIERARFQSPAGEQLNIRPGLPDEEDIDRAARTRARNIEGAAKTAAEVARSTGITGLVTDALESMFGPGVKFSKPDRPLLDRLKNPRVPDRETN